MEHKHEHALEKKVEEVVDSVVIDNESEGPLMSEDKRDIRISKKAIFVVACVALILMLGYYFKGLFVVAIVNGSPISRLEVIHELERSAGKQALQGIIIERLIESEAKKRGVVITNDELNTQIQAVRDQVTAQGGTLEDALAQQGSSLAEFTKQMTMQAQVEKMLGDKVAVTPEEVDAYIATNKLKIPDAQMEVAKKQIADQLKRDKMNKEGQAFVDSLKESAKITTFVSY